MELRRRDQGEDGPWSFVVKVLDVHEYVDSPFHATKAYATRSTRQYHAMNMPTCKLSPHTRTCILPERFGRRPAEEAEGRPQIEAQNRPDYDLGREPDRLERDENQLI